MVSKPQFEPEDRRLIIILLWVLVAVALTGGLTAWAVSG